MNKLKRALVDSDSNIKTLLVYLKEAEQILSSAVYQSKMKLSMIKKAKPLPADLLVRYAHKISADYGVCCPENWVPDYPKRPYPTDADLRRGWLTQISSVAGELNKMDIGSGGAGSGSSSGNSNPPSVDQKPDLIRSNSKSIIFIFQLA
jgi:mediator of RNA polymerase II transcription subunit 4